MIADVLVTAGNCTVNVLVEVLSAPKSSTQTAPLSPALYIKAPLAVIAPVHAAFEKEMYAVAAPVWLPVVGTWDTVNKLPPAT
jgi:hypothetical protein